MKRERILVIEDSMGVARALNRALSLSEGGGYWVEVCHTGEAALELLADHHFDLLISDLRLPGISGLDVLERVRESSPDTRSILITAFGSPEVEERARQLSDAYLPKPFHLQDIIHIVERVLTGPIPPEQPHLELEPELELPLPSVTDLDAADRERAAHLIVLACDVDSVLSGDGKLTPETWELLREAKVAGLHLIVVSGHPLDDLVTQGAYVELCEAIVAESGAVIYFPRRDSVILPFGRLSPGVSRRVQDLDVPHERRTASVTIDVQYDEAILDVLREAGGGAVAEYGRDVVTVLPPGATKGTGLSYAVRELGYSPRNTVACGETANDLGLFEMVELAVATADASPDVKAQADLVLPQAEGLAIHTLVTDLVAGRVPAFRSRPQRHLLLGHGLSGAPVYLSPFALVNSNLGIFGASGSGKSWLAGLLAEELLRQRYQICIIDPEGDYRALGMGPHTLLLGGPETRLPSVTDLVDFLESACISLVLDLSTYSTEERTAYVLELIEALWSLRARRGRPHWLLLDEVQSLCPPGNGELIDLLLDDTSRRGLGLVSYRPSHVARPILEALDRWLVTRLSLPQEIEALRPFLSRYGGGSEMLTQLPVLPVGQAYLYFGDTGKPSQVREFVRFRAGSRVVPHVRHLHKYLRAPLPAYKMFYFHDESGHSLGRAAANLWEFREALAELPLGCIRFHLLRGDFERWLRDVLRDDELARRVRKVADRAVGDRQRGLALRQALLEVVIRRYEELENLI